MKPKTLEKMQYFLGKVCSIVTSSMNRSFDEQISREHFVVRIEEINADGIWGTHPYNNEMVSFYSMEHIISIHEEIELDPNNPEHAALIQQYEERTGQKAESDLHGAPKQEQKGCGGDCSCGPKEKPPVPPPVQETDGEATFVDIDSLEQLAEHTKKTFDAKNLLSN